MNIVDMIYFSCELNRQSIKMLSCRCRKDIKVRSYAVHTRVTSEKNTKRRSSPWVVWISRKQV